MNENLKKFFEKLAADEALQAKLQAAKDPDAAYAIASEVASGFTKEEFVDLMTKLQAANDGELGDADLASAAGGGIDDDIESVIDTSISVVSAISIQVVDSVTDTINKSVKTISKAAKAAAV